jgi:hypothetical protein
MAKHGHIPIVVTIVGLVARKKVCSGDANWFDESKRYEVRGSGGNEWTPWQ